MINNDWKSFLTAQQATLNEQGAITALQFPELERTILTHGPALTSLAHDALLKVSGEDALSFLNGQFTNDIKRVTEDQACYSAYCDPKGQVLAMLLIFKVADNYYLSFDGSLKDIIQKRLQMFIMRSKVTLTDVSQDWIKIGYAGQFADLEIQRRLDVKLKKVLNTAQAKDEGFPNLTLVKVPGPYHSYEIFAPVTTAQTAWDALKRNGEATNYLDWRLLKILAGIPSVNAQTSGQFIAQFLNLDKLDQINFKKGCYPGQEIIARLHYRSQPSKRMFRLKLAQSVDLQPGTELNLMDDNDKKHKFEVVAATADIFSGTQVLAVATVKSLEAAIGQLQSELTGLVTIEPHPYPMVSVED
jgi:folate-binding protein YgfZ